VSERSPATNSRPRKRRSPGWPGTACPAPRSPPSCLSAPRRSSTTWAGLRQARRDLAQPASPRPAQPTQPWL